MKQKKAVIVVVLACVNFILMLAILRTLMQTPPPLPPDPDPEVETVEDAPEETPPEEPPTGEASDQTPEETSRDTGETIGNNDNTITEDGETADGQERKESDEPGGGAEPDALADTEAEDSYADDLSTDKEEISTESTRSPFLIDPSQKESYSYNLDPDEYLSYYSDTDDFYFSYPPHLYNRVESDYSPFTTAGGENIESHTFYGSRGSELSFQLIRRTDVRNLAAVSDKLVQQESGEITNAFNKLLDEPEKKTRFARTVITGTDSAGWIIYKLIYVTPDHIMEMKIFCPPYREDDSDKDKHEKRYVQDCIYKFCSFANEKAGSPISYSEYLESISQ